MPDEEFDTESLIENATYQVELAEALGCDETSLLVELRDDLDGFEDSMNAKQESGGLFFLIGAQLRKLLPSSWRLSREESER